MLTSAIIACSVLLAPGASLEDAAAEVVSQLGSIDGRVLIGLPKGDSLSRKVHQALTKKLIGAGATVVDRESFLKTVEENQLSDSLGGAELQELAGGLGAAYVLNVTLAPVEGDTSVSVKLVDVETGKLIKSASATFSDTGAGIDSSKSLRGELRRLGDKLAEAIKNSDSEVRYHHFAVLPFGNVGETTEKKQLGLLVASELTTLLSRDHGLMLVERTQIDSVLGEIALGQSGVIDESQSAQVGKMAGAHALIVGTVSDAGAEYLVNAKVVSTEAANVLVSEQATLPAADLVALSSEAVVLRSRMGGFYRSLLLPGWGQFYNREPIKAGVIAGVEVVTAALGLTYHFIGSKHEDDYKSVNAPISQVEFQRMVDKAEDAYKLRNIFLISAGLIHAFNVVDAVISGKTYDSAVVGGSGTMGYRLTW